MALDPAGKGATRFEDIHASLSGGTLYLILIQVTSRLLTFVGNQFILRYLSLGLLGVSVQLELFSVSVLYFSRESLRVTLQRQPKIDDGGSSKAPFGGKSARSRQTQIIVNLSSIAIVLGLFLTVGLGWLYHQSQSSNLHSQGIAGFDLSLSVYALATFLELCSEPAFIVIQERSLYNVRARTETAAAVAKCAATCTATLYMHQRELEASILPFAIGQLIYAIFLTTGHVMAVLRIAEREQFSLFPCEIDKSPDFLIRRFYWPLLSVAVTLYVQSGFKQVLTQGDALVLGFFASLEDQGAFALASNYGGLIARLVFQPVEESSRNTFGSLLSPSSKQEPARHKDIQLAFDHLRQILHIYSILAVLSSCFLYTILPICVHLLMGSTWFTDDFAATLSAYCYYIPFAAFNGILEAFVTSVANSTELRNQSIWMAAFMIVYVVAVYLLVDIFQLGARGLIWSNIISMSLRILWCCWFITGFSSTKGQDARLFRTMLPSPQLTIVGVVTASAVQMRHPETRAGLGALAEALPLCLLGGCIM